MTACPNGFLPDDRDRLRKWERRSRLLSGPALTVEYVGDGKWSVS